MRPLLDCSRPPSSPSCWRGARVGRHGRPDRSRGPRSRPPRVRHGTPTSLPSEIGSIGPFSPAGCPIPDPAFCTPAAALAEAIVAGDTPAIVALSRPDVFRCEDLDAAIFTGCQDADVLEGHPIGTSGGNIEVFDATAYGQELDSTAEAIDPAFSDDAGTGEARVLGTSACGPDDPTRRSYYVAWTAGLGAAPGDAERVVGLYEFTFRDDRWLVGNSLSRLRRRLAGAPRRPAARRRLRDLALGSRLTRASARRDRPCLRARRRIAAGATALRRPDDGAGGLATAAVHLHHA